MTRLILALVLGASSLSAQATLIDRGGGLIYDDVLNITWLQDANYAQTSRYSVDGRMSWDDAVAWAAGLSYYDSVRDVTYTNWRLPTITDTGPSGCDNAYSGTDCGYNVDTGSGEMASLFYDTLGNIAYYDTSGNPEQPGWGMSNTGPFTNIQTLNYWSNTEYAPDTGRAWDFRFLDGFQSHIHKWGLFYAWAVRNGDVAPIPIPAAAWLFASALGALGWVRRRRA